MKDLTGRAAIVTGASRGIGPTIARALARQGVRLVLTARSTDELEAVRHKLEDGGAEAIAVPADVGTAPGRQSVIQTATDAFGHVDLLINNAAVTHRSRFDEARPEEISSVISVNIEAPLLLARMVLPGMVDRGTGHVVNISSLAGKVGTPYQATYSASKAALVAWTESVRLELAGTGVSASVICPGFVSGEGMYARSAEETGASAPGWLGTSTPAQVANAVVRAIRGNQGEVIVNRGPMRPLLAAAELAPGLGEFVMKRSGVLDRYAKVAAHHGMDT